MRGTTAGGKVKEPRPRGLAGFVDRYGDELSEVAWLACLAWIEQACERARERRGGRWRNYPGGELRWLRHELAGALSLARFAVAVSEENHDLVLELTREVRAAAERADFEARREQTAEATRVRLLLAAARREGRTQLTSEERWPWLYENGQESS